MADQWASTDDHSPAVGSPAATGGWSSTDDHAPSGGWLDPNYVAPVPKMTTAPGETLKNSLSNTIGGFANAVIHPYDTAKNLLQVGAGTVENMNPVSSPAPATESQQKASAVGQYLGNRARHPLDTLNTDPIGALADASVLAEPAEIGLRGTAMVADCGPCRINSRMHCVTGAKCDSQCGDIFKSDGRCGESTRLRSASKAAGALTKVRQPLAPIEQAAVDYALNDPTLLGTVDVATATGNKSLGAQKSLLRKFPTSAGIVGDAEKAQQAAITAKMGDLSTGVSPGGPSYVFTSGQKALAAIKSKLNDYSAVAKDAFENRLYGAADANPQMVQTGIQTQSIPNPAAATDPTAPLTIQSQVPIMESIAGPTDMTGVKAVAGPLLDQLKTQMRVTRTAASPLTSMLEDIVNGPDVVSLRTAKDNISTIQTLARNEAGAMRSKAQALSSMLVSPFHDAVDAAAQAVGPDAYQALQDGNAATRAKYDLAKAIPGSYLKKDVPPANLVQLHDLLTKPEDAQFPALQKVATHTPGVVPDIARATIEDIFRGTTENGGISKVQSAINSWNKLGPKTKALLFGPQTTDEIDQLLHYSKMAVSEANPSGTAPTAQMAALAAMMFHNPVAAIAVMAGARGLAKGIMSPEVAETVRATGRVPLPSVGAAGNLAAPFTNVRYVNAGRAVNTAVNPYRQ